MVIRPSRVRFSSVPPLTRGEVVKVSTKPSHVVMTTRGPLKTRANISSVETTPVVYDEYYGCTYRPSAQGGRDSWSAYRISDETLDDADDLVYNSKQKDADVLREVDRQMTSALEPPIRTLKKRSAGKASKAPAVPTFVSRRSRIVDGSDFKSDELEGSPLVLPRVAVKTRHGRTTLAKPRFGLGPISMPLETVHESKALAFRPPEVTMVRSTAHTPTMTIRPSTSSTVRATHKVKPLPVTNTSVYKSKFVSRQPIRPVTTGHVPVISHQNKMLVYEEDLSPLPGASNLKERVRSARELSDKQKLLLDRHLPATRSKFTNMETVQRAERAASAPPPQNPHKVSTLRSHLREVLKRTGRK